MCQLRFNQILKISTTPPVAFQEQVRRQFPVVGQEHGIQLAVAPNQPVIAAANEPAWQFKTADDGWTVSLSSSALALKTIKYQTFEDSCGAWIWSSRRSNQCTSHRSTCASVSGTSTGWSVCGRTMPPSPGTSC